MAQPLPEPAEETTESNVRPLRPASPTSPDPLDVAKEIVQLASDKGAADVLLMDIRRLSIIADYFVICSGDNERQIRAISRGITEGVDERWGLDPLHSSGTDHERA